MKFILVAKMNESNLEEIIVQLWHNEAFRRRAEELGAEIKTKNFRQQIL